MAFHIDTYNIPPIRCYNDALNYWGRIKPWRGTTGSDKNERPLAGRNKKHMTIRMLNDESIAFRLHGTDVVIYHTDTTVTLHGYPSVSTDMFARCLTPSGICTSFNSGAGMLVHLGRENTTMTHRMANNTVRLMRDDNGDWLPVDPAMFEPFVKYRIDTKRANAALKQYGLKDFQAWVKARAAMSNPPANRYMPSSKYHNAWHETLTKFTIMGDGWEELFATYGRNAGDVVRDSIYKIENCIIKTEVPYVAGYDVSTIQASANKWRRLANQF